ncbi:hypothetical protein GCM10007094_23870 [Pseudovibrio japonicus]|uniref:Uncharacterized protein n=1 Tax=Pseudovibrio japonicus TaxID=366534 RepID=A0ABQ3ED84_9HYPH|nr:hypothetical protein [Pseudovibrio japonicus]GHB34060.1 hypothetical protein GCM10007094_23870 [Pseudovibrio japonicus]
MSLERIFLRLATVAALTNFYQDPYPTVAEGRVFDSKVVPNDDLFGSLKDEIKEFKPVCVVYTDYDKDLLNHHTVRPSDERIMTVTLELFCATLDQDEVDGEDAVSLVYPGTDSELEILLDVFEHQVFESLFLGTNSASEYVKFAVRALKNVVSRRGATFEGGQKLAARQVTLEIATGRLTPNRKLPIQLSKFLDELATLDQHAHQIPKLRALYERNGTELENKHGWLGYTDAVSKALGAEQFGTLTIPLINWIDAR